MPPRIRYDVLVVDQSPLARNMYEILFSGHDRFRLTFADEFQSLFKRSTRFRPDLLLINSNALPVGERPQFPIPTLLLVSKKRSDLKEAFAEDRRLSLLEKPFYPYDLLSVATRLIREKQETPRRGRPPGRRKKK